MSTNDDIQDRLVSLRLDLLSVSTEEQQKVLGLLHALEADLVALLEDSGVASSRTVRTRRARLRQLLADTRSTIRQTYDTIQASTQETLVSAALTEGLQITSVMNDIIGGNVLQATLSEADLRSIARGNILQGHPASRWWKRQEQALQDRFEQEIAMGIAQGESIDQMVRRVRGRNTGKRQVIRTPSGKRRIVSQSTGGIMDASYREAQSLVRTSVLNVSNQAIYQTYQENADVISGVYAIVTLDNRTSHICQARDGGSWDLVTGAPLPDSSVDEPFPGPPPWHFNCRTVLGPVTKSWQELIDDRGTPGNLKAELREFTPSMRASMDGLVPAGTTYSEWLAKRSQSQALEILGAARYDMWKSGRITLKQMIDHQTGKILTLDELGRIYKANAVSRNLKSTIAREPAKLLVSPANADPIKVPPATARRQAAGKLSSAEAQELEDIRRRLAVEFGVNKPLEDVARILIPEVEDVFGGVPVVVSLQSDAIKFAATSKGSSIIQNLRVDPTDGTRLISSLSNFTLAEDLRSQGKGIEIFSEIIRRSRRLGLSVIEGVASRTDARNGAISLAFWGFNGDLPAGVEKIARWVPKPQQVSDILNLSGGSRFWQKNAESYLARFEIDPESYSMRRLALMLDLKNRPEMEGGGVALPGGVEASEEVAKRMVGRGQRSVPRNAR